LGEVRGFYGTQVIYVSVDVVTLIRERVKNEDASGPQYEYLFGRPNVCVGVAW
jgi:hypothetical protein